MKNRAETDKTEFDREMRELEAEEKKLEAEIAIFERKKQWYLQTKKNGAVGGKGKKKWNTNLSIDLISFDFIWLGGIASFTAEIFEKFFL